MGNVIEAKSVVASGSGNNCPGIQNSWKIVSNAVPDTHQSLAQHTEVFLATLKSQAI